MGNFMGVQMVNPFVCNVLFSCFYVDGKMVYHFFGSPLVYKIRSSFKFKL